MPSEVSLIHPYYNNETRLALQLDVWSKWSPEVCKAVDITLVDDGSPRPLVFTDEQKKMFNDKGIKVAVYRILEDLKWNTPGALNLGVFVAPKAWVLFMDSDCFFPSSEWEKILKLEHPMNRIGKFKRQRYGDPKVENLKNDRYLNCTMLMHKTIFTTLGGFDEDFTGKNSGGYGFFDTDFDWRAQRLGVWSERSSNGKHHVYSNIVAGEWMPTVCAEPVARDHGSHHAINKALLDAKYKNEKPRNKQILNFSWKQTYSNWL